MNSASEIAIWTAALTEHYHQLELAPLGDCYLKLGSRYHFQTLYPQKKRPINGRNINLPIDTIAAIEDSYYPW